MSGLPESDRLSVVRLLPAHVTDAYVNGLNDAEVVARTEAAGRAWSRAEVLDYVAAANAPGVSELLGLMVKPEARHIGNIRLSGFSQRHRHVALGIMLFDRQSWGQGYGTEALRLACNYVFDSLGLHRVCADYHATNVASARIFAKAGFRIEGVFREHFRVPEGYVDSVRVALLASERPTA